LNHSRSLFLARLRRNLRPSGRRKAAGAGAVDFFGAIAIEV